MKSPTERASAYLARMPVSVSGQRGDAAAFRAAVALVRGFDLSEQEALPLLARWNEACLPPWRENDLRHKLRSAATSTGRPAGYLLPKSASSSSSSSSSSRKATQNTQGPKTKNSPHGPAQSHIPHSASSSHQIPHPTMNTPPTEDRAWLRDLWPEFHPLTRDDIRVMAKQRGIYPDAVDLAHRHGFLRTAEFHGHRCLVITEGTFAQVRRLDALPLVKADGTRIKARNLSGSQGAFIGQRWLPGTTHVLLVEGAIGLIEGLAAMLLVNTPHAWSILAATSASSRFARDSALWEQLRGKEVHIVPDADEAGGAAAASWLADLQAAGVHATAHRLPKPCKDLGDVFHLPEAERQQTFHNLFIPQP